MCSLLAASVLQNIFNDQRSVNKAQCLVTTSEQQQSCCTATVAIYSFTTSVGVRYHQKYLKRRFLYSRNHPGSYNPAVSTNEEAHMVNGNMDQQGSSDKQKSKKRPRSAQITEFFSKTTQKALSASAGRLSVKLII